MILSCLTLTLSLVLAGPSSLDLSLSEDRAEDRQLSHREMERFLETAEIKERMNLSVGVTKSQRLTLSDGNLTHDAHSQSIDRMWKEFRTGGRTYLSFHDSYRFNIAAYRLNRLLGLDMVPVSVERRIAGKRAAVTWWVDDVQMMELDRHQQGTVPPDSGKWSELVSRIRVFNQWVGNADPNMGNILITDDWDLWMIDFTRAFNPIKRLTAKLPSRIERRLYERLAAVSLEQLSEELGDVLSKREIRALLSRRDRILDFYGDRIAERGESMVFRDPPKARSLRYRYPPRSV